MQKMIDACQNEIDRLWDDFEKEKRRIMTEEYDREQKLYYNDEGGDSGRYWDDYADHWRVEELVERTYKAEDEIIEKHHPILEEAG